MTTDKEMAGARPNRTTGQAKHLTVCRDYTKPHPRMDIKEKPPRLVHTGASEIIDYVPHNQCSEDNLSAFSPQPRLEIRAVSSINTRSHGLFDWADHGPLAQACEVSDSSGHIIDACAWYPETPSCWWLLAGAGRVLGAHALEVANPIHLYGTPAAWLKANDPRGVCILRWDIWPAHLFGPRQVKCDSQQLAEKVLRRHREMPPPFEVAA